MKVLNVVGARPNFMKMAPLVAELNARDISQTLVHTGQHYDARMSQVFFDDLGLPRPDIDLDVGSASHAVQTAEVMTRFEPILKQIVPDVVVVVGDVNSTLACSLVAAKMGVPVAHVEAGLRSFDRAMPEEINRIVTDHLSDFLFTHSPDADEHLAHEGIDAQKVHRVGNIMIDSLLKNREKSLRSNVLSTLGLTPGGYAVVTLHRPSNVDDPTVLGGLIDALAKIAAQIPVVFPRHPRTAKMLEEFGLSSRVSREAGFIVTEPLGYLDFLGLSGQSKMVLTDSGGLQEESTVFGIPCLTLRENTERPITIEVGSNILVGSDPVRIEEEAARILDGNPKAGRVPDLWDGHTAERIVDVFSAAFD